MTRRKGKPNRLVNESSPYLQQHAFNPVDWYSWGKEAHDKAAAEDKPIILSIGYSSCHWCHVMERESFESEETAELMNSLFVCIKIDREERPDIDQVYMDAVQAMGVHGGWPLNVFLTPDLKPFYGGTYFRPAAWKQLLANVSALYKNSQAEVRESADKFAEYIAKSDVEKYDLRPEDEIFKFGDLAASLEKISSRFDTAFGGTQRAPKFPMPSLLTFLLYYGFKAGNEMVRDHVILTLKKMGAGGIFDQVGGGFSRYSVDEKWFVPHFEKMLYDNAQLLALYSESYRLVADPEIRRIVYQTAGFIRRELTSPEGGFYSALDADSEGIEGKFYTWTGEEFKLLLSGNTQALREYWGIREEGNWEEGRNIISIAGDENQVCSKYKISPQELNDLVEKSQALLLEARSSRVRPALDHKIITAWNGMMINGLAQAYITFNDEEFIAPAIKNAELILSVFRDRGSLPRNMHDFKSSTPGFLDDYAFVIEALITLFQATCEEKWILYARKLAELTVKNFYDKDENLFFYAGEDAKTPVARKKEIFDNVIPASNSVMALNLFKLGKILDHGEFSEIPVKMMSRMRKMVIDEPEYLSNWGKLFCLMSDSFAEIAVIGPDFIRMTRELLCNFIPGKVVLGTVKESGLPLFKGRKAINDRTTIYVCYNKSCRLPVHSTGEALQLLQ